MNMYPLQIYHRLLADIRMLSGVPIGAPDDLQYSWCLIEAPRLDKEILAYLDKKSDSVTLPEWLMPLWDRFILTDDPIYLRYIRQILVFCYKAEQQPTQDQLKDAQASFEETEEGVALWTRYHSDNPYSHLLASARRIIGSVIYRANWSEIVPSHGPGGIYPSRKPCHKSRFRTFYTSIASHYPYDQYFCGIPSFWEDYFVKGDKDLEVSDDIVAKLVAVPKDSRGPRLICVHPSEAIWIQQGQRKLLEACISAHPLTSGKINFTDQSVNGKLACSSSIDREFCTLDLKEASDRISCSLVRSLFGDHAYEWLSCSRANKIKLLDGRVVELKKWAPMGNCLTFPVQSLIFFSLVVAGIRSYYSHNCNDVYVFGDDIIFPTKFYDGVIRTLVSFGMVPNYAKTFRTGFFRESCGVDAYKGVNVTPHRLRRSDTSSLSHIVSLLDLAKRLRLDGYDMCSSFIYESCRKALLKKHRGINLPRCNSINAAGLYEYVDSHVSSLKLQKTTVYNRKLQMLGTRVCLVTGALEGIVEGDWYHLQDSLVRLANSRPKSVLDLVRSTSIPATLQRWESSSISDRGTEYPIPYRSRLQYGWTPYLY